MKKASIVLVVLFAVFSLVCSSLVAEEPEEKPGDARKEYPGVSQEQGEVRKDDDWNEPVERREGSPDQRRGPYGNLLGEMENLRNENRALREEIQFLREEMIRLMSEMIDRQHEEIRTLRIMLEEQHNFVRELLKQEYEIRKARQFMEARQLGMDQHIPDIERELRELEEELARHPDNVELRVKLGHIYREVGNIDAAIEQFKTALSINPDFDPAFRGLEELRAEFPDESGELRDVLIERFPDRDREQEELLEDAAGTVVSANKREIRLRTREGHEVTFMVPHRQKEDGSWVLNEDLSKFVVSLNTGARVMILWQEVEDQRVIRKIERIEGEE